jgi:hypothetical protein
MLFDLQGRGRRNVVKVIYVFLAVLLGGGLVLFGVGTGTGGGGLLDVFGGGGTSTKVQVSQAEKRATRAVQLNPQDATAWATLARTRYQNAGQGENYNADQAAFTAKGLAELGRSSAAWQRYLALKPTSPDVTLARLMSQAYSQNGLNQPANATAALQIVTEAQPSSSSFGQLAQYAYLAGQDRLGDLAASKSVDLAPKEQKATVKDTLANTKRQIALQRARAATGQGTSTAPTG